MSVHVPVCGHTELEQRVFIADVFKISVIDAELSIVQELNHTYMHIVYSDQRHNKQQFSSVIFREA